MTEVDILVIGGGVNGTAIARDAAGRGLRVALCEMNDLASGTSSASTKLIHGGLRYLEHREFNLVRKSLIERDILLRTAPHLVKPMRFILPHERGQRPRWLLRLGLFIYDWLGPKNPLLPPSHGIDLSTGIEAFPLKDDLTKGFVYSDCWVDDARLVVMNAVDAAARGAEVTTRTKCTALAPDKGEWLATLETSDGDSRVLRARAVVNAAGPWVGDMMSRIAGPGNDAKVPLRLVQGSHIIVPRLFEGEHAYLFQNADGRIMFAIPYEDEFTLLGTTERPFTGDPADVRASDEEIAYLCDAANHYFKPQTKPADVVHTYAGVRPLYDDASHEDASAVTRDYVFDLETDAARPPLLTIYGGKLTTCRKLAEHALEELKPILGFDGDAWTEDAPLAGGDLDGGEFESFMTRLRARFVWMPLADIKRLARAYGTHAADFLEDARSEDDLGMAFGRGFSEAELKYLRSHEWAVTAEDVLWRRSKLGLHLSADEQKQVEDWFRYGSTVKTG